MMNNNVVAARAGGRRLSMRGSAQQAFSCGYYCSVLRPDIDILTMMPCYVEISMLFAAMLQ